MGEAFFYHLTRRPLEAVLPDLLEKSLARGWRVSVRGTQAQRMDWLDQKLWLGPEEGFLPHGLAGGPHDADQPVLLTLDAEATNDPGCLMCIDGAALQRARDQWRSLTGAGCKAQYWSEESGRWEKKAES